MYLHIISMLTPVALNIVKLTETDMLGEKEPACQSRKCKLID